MAKVYDIAIVGGGPAGLTAAIYGLRNGKSVIVIEKDVFGGQIVNSPKVENIPGFDSISGDEYGDKLLNQVNNLGGEVCFDKVLSVEGSNILNINLEMSEALQAKTVILATGTTHRRLNLVNEESLIGNGIHFCAVCDGNFYEGKDVVLVGGGNSAFVEANHLVNIVNKLTILQDLPTFTADKMLQDSLFNNHNIETHTNTKVIEYLLDNGKLVGLKYLENNQEKTIKCDGVFLAIGLIPDNKAFENVAELDKRGYFVSDESTTTKTANVFVAGDARSKSLRQVTTACSDGANAAIKACEYLR